MQSNIFSLRELYCLLILAVHTFFWSCPLSSHTEGWIIQRKLWTCDPYSEGSSGSDMLWGLFPGMDRGPVVPWCSQIFDDSAKLGSQHMTECRRENIQTSNTCRCLFHIQRIDLWWFIASCVAIFLCTGCIWGVMGSLEDRAELWANECRVLLSCHAAALHEIAGEAYDEALFWSKRLCLNLQCTRGHWIVWVWKWCESCCWLYSTKGNSYWLHLTGVKIGWQLPCD